MHQNVLAFPGHNAPRSDDPPSDRRDRANPHVLTFGQVAFALGIRGRSIGYQTGYIRQLHTRQNFPAPLPSYNKTRNELIQGEAAITPRAQWQRAAVDAWFDGQLPPGALASRLARETAADAAALDANAASLFGPAEAAAL